MCKSVVFLCVMCMCVVLVKDRDLENDEYVLIGDYICVFCVFVVDWWVFWMLFLHLCWWFFVCFSCICYCVMREWWK